MRIAERGENSCRRRVSSREKRVIPQDLLPDRVCPSWRSRFAQSTNPPNGHVMLTHERLSVDEYLCASKVMYQWGFMDVLRRKNSPDGVIQLVDSRRDITCPFSTFRSASGTVPRTKHSRPAGKCRAGKYDLCSSVHFCIDEVAACQATVLRTHEVESRCCGQCSYNSTLLGSYGVTTSCGQRK